MDFSVLIMLVVLMLLAVTILSKQISNKKKVMEEKLSSLNDFSATQQIMGSDGNSGIAVDEGRKKICLIKQGDGNKGIELDVISYRDILSTEIFEDGQTITKTARGSQLGGILIGGLALGGVGAIIGGLSGKTTSSDKVNKIDLRITVNRTSNPNHDISFMNAGIKKHGFIYTEVMKKARHWHGLFEVLIKRADSEDVAKEGEQVVENTNTFIADELAKLSELKNQGLLNDAEFSKQKEKLLS